MCPPNTPARGTARSACATAVPPRWRSRARRAPGEPGGRGPSRPPRTTGSPSPPGPSPYRGRDEVVQSTQWKGCPVSSEGDPAPEVDPSWWEPAFAVDDLVEAEWRPPEITSRHLAQLANNASAKASITRSRRLLGGRYRRRQPVLLDRYLGDRLDERLDGRSARGATAHRGKDASAEVTSSSACGVRRTRRPAGTRSLTPVSRSRVAICCETAEGLKNRLRRRR